jgi:hypothetical protein
VLKHKHYAPNAEVVVVEGRNIKDCGQSEGVSGTYIQAKAKKVGFSPQMKHFSIIHG